MFAIGHFALGYIFGRGTSKLAKVALNLPLLLATSILPDVDLLFRFLIHRGPTHSIITISVLMIPFFIIYRKQALPYFAAMLTHILIGDFFTGGSELFWPLSHDLFGILNFEVTSLGIEVVELVLFLVVVPVMYKMGDLQTLLKPHNKNWALIIPLGSVIGPLISLGRGQEGSLPALLVVPSLLCIVIFAYSIFIWLRAGIYQNKNRLQLDSAYKVSLMCICVLLLDSVNHQYLMFINTHYTRCKVREQNNETNKNTNHSNNRTNNNRTSPNPNNRCSSYQ